MHCIDWSSSLIELTENWADLYHHLGPLVEGPVGSTASASHLNALSFFHGYIRLLSLSSSNRIPPGTHPVLSSFKYVTFGARRCAQEGDREVMK